MLSTNELRRDEGLLISDIKLIPARFSLLSCAEKNRKCDYEQDFRR